MLQAGGDAGFAGETAPDLTFGGAVRKADEFDGDFPVQLGVMTDSDLTHPVQGQRQLPYLIALIDHLTLTQRSTSGSERLALVPDVQRGMPRPSPGPAVLIAWVPPARVGAEHLVQGHPAR